MAAAGESKQRRDYLGSMYRTLFHPWQQFLRCPTPVIRCISDDRFYKGCHFVQWDQLLPRVFLVMVVMKTDINFFFSGDSARTLRLKTGLNIYGACYTHYPQMNLHRGKSMPSCVTPLWSNAYSIWMMVRCHWKRDIELERREWNRFTLANVRRS